MKNLIKDYRYNYAYFFGGFMKYNAPFILIGLFVTMWLYCPWVKPYAEDLHHKVDSAPVSYTHLTLPTNREV